LDHNSTTPAKTTTTTKQPEQLCILRSKENGKKGKQNNKKKKTTKTNQLQLQATQNSYWTDFLAYKKKELFEKNKNKQKTNIENINKISLSERLQVTRFFFKHPKAKRIS